MPIMKYLKPTVNNACFQIIDPFKDYIVLNKLIPVSFRDPKLQIQFMSYKDSVCMNEIDIKHATLENHHFFEAIESSILLSEALRLVGWVNLREASCGDNTLP